MQVYRDDGVVLRTHKLGEADRIITLLCRQNGRVRAVAKGIRRTKSRFGARLEPFTHVDLMIHNGRTLDVITQAEVIRAYGMPLAADYPKYTAGVAMLETAEKLTPVEQEPAIRQFLLLIGGLRALGESAGPDQDGDEDSDFAADDPDETEAGPTGGGPSALGLSLGPDRGVRGVAPPEDREPGLVLDAYLLRSLAVAGYAPALEECARCGRSGRVVRLTAFAVGAGGMVCESCRPPGSASPGPQTVALMIALLQGDWGKAMGSERRHRVECSGLVAAYLQWHLEHSIRSLRHVERA
ncbi:MAG TPA: DNA repair protein RecO [Trebonia sp.]|jgi:DNA repair protein RecO (recombination protein O)|nr:DNA repair protein RecO [Trebonia sp.]